MSPQLQCRKRDGSRQPNRVGPGPKKKSPGAGIAEARTHYTERTTTQTKYNRALQNALDLWQFCDAFLSISLLTTRIWGVRLTPHS